MKTVEPKNTKLSLSDAVARDASLPAKGDYIIWDSKVMYFGLRVQSGGSKTWIVQKKLGKRPCRVNIGVFSKDGVDARTGYTAAKAKVAETVAFISKGIDPNLEKRQQLLKTEHTRTQEEYTVQKCFKDYVNDKISDKKTKPLTILDFEKTRQRIESSPLKNISVLALSGQHLADYYDASAKSESSKSSRATNGGHTQRGGDLRYLRAAYNLCALKSKLDFPKNSPFVELNNRRKGWYRVKAKSRIVAGSEGDLKKWWAAVEALRPEGGEHLSRDVLADYLELSLLWGGRRGELLSLRWDNISLEDDFVCIPGAGTEFADGTKNSIDHIFPLTVYAKKLLMKRLRVNDEQVEQSPWIFPSRRKNKSGERAHIVEAKSAIKAVASACGLDFSAHDLRRTFGTLFNEMHVSDYTIKRALNHAPTDTASKHYLKSRLSALRSIYQEYEDKVFIEAGLTVISTPKVSINAEDFAKFQTWLANEAKT